MPSTLTAKVYKELLRGNIKWLEEQPRTLERDHIISMLKFEIDTLVIYYSPYSDKEELRSK